MSEGKDNSLADRLRAHFGDRVSNIVERLGQTTVEVQGAHWLEVARALRDEPQFRFEQLIDLCGVDYLGYGEDEWATSEEATSEGFSRGVEGAAGPGRFSWSTRPRDSQFLRRFASVTHLLSLKNNMRLRVRVFAPEDALPVVPSVISVWPVADWFEREAFDLYGIIYEGHPDLRRILTDYGFVGHPFRKDFPLSGYVEMRYDPEQKRVVYQPVTIDPREVTPRIVREPNYAHGK